MLVLFYLNNYDEKALTYHNLKTFLVVRTGVYNENPNKVTKQTNLTNNVFFKKVTTYQQVLLHSMLYLLRWVHSLYLDYNLTSSCFLEFLQKCLIWKNKTELQLGLSTSKSVSYSDQHLSFVHELVTETVTMCQVGIQQLQSLQVQREREIHKQRNKVLQCISLILRHSLSTIKRSYVTLKRTDVPGRLYIKCIKYPDFRLINMKKHPPQNL